MIVWFFRTRILFVPASFGLTYNNRSSLRREQHNCNASDHGKDGNRPTPSLRENFRETLTEARTRIQLNAIVCGRKRNIIRSCSDRRSKPPSDAAFGTRKILASKASSFALGQFDPCAAVSARQRHNRCPLNLFIPIKI
jgi:hypothetical protein